MRGRDLAIILDYEQHHALAKTIGARLRAARLLAGVSEDEVAVALGYKNATQVCIAEKGNGRIPPATAMLAYAELYGCSIDYLFGRLDDPKSNPITLQKEITGRNLTEFFGHPMLVAAEVMCEMLEKPMIEHQVADLKAARRHVERSMELEAAWRRMRELNPGFDEAIRGAARMQSAINGVAEHSRKLEASANEQATKVENATRAVLATAPDDADLSVLGWGMLEELRDNAASGRASASEQQPKMSHGLSQHNVTPA